MPFDGETNVKDGKWGHVWATKGLHLARALFRGSVPSQNFVVKVDDNLGYLEWPSYHEGAEKVVHGVTAQLTYGNLAACHHNCFI